MKRTSFLDDGTHVNALTAGALAAREQDGGDDASWAQRTAAAWAARDGPSGDDATDDASWAARTDAAWAARHKAESAQESSTPTPGRKAAGISRVPPPPPASASPFKQFVDPEPIASPGARPEYDTGDARRPRGGALG